VRNTSTDIAFYEGLVRKTASMIAPLVQEEYDDIVAILRIKVWRALVAYDASRASLPVERYVFMCVTNQKKDILKRKRRHEVPLDESYDDPVDAELVYAAIEDVTPVIPNTLGMLERQAAQLLGLTRREMERTLEGVRTKMADWRPTAVTVAPERQLAA
jgi:DNA-directed RNA polymerase specialized sigma24 family protein